MRHRHVMPFGAEQVADGVRFAIWAPNPCEVTLVVDGAEHPLARRHDGWRSMTIGDARIGSRYGYRIGDELVPDPASRFQPDDVAGLSAVVDPTAYRWHGAEWRGRPWEEAVIYEAHVGTATPAGTFAGLAEELPRLAELGITAVELMPVGEFPGRRNWGYDGVLPYAPDASYGSPDDLKRLIDRAHGLGLMMILDVVYNHFGPSGNHLAKYAESFFTERHVTPWGAGFNVDGREGRAVRDYFIHNALFWLEEYCFDGLRLDAVHAIRDGSDPHLLGELASRCRAFAPDRHIHLILENERNEASWLRRDEAGRPILHTAQWNDDLHHCWHVLLTGEQESYYGDFADDPVRRLRRALTEGFVYQGEASQRSPDEPRGEPSGHLPPSAFVSFLQNHDQVGNRALGDRLAAEPGRLSLARAGLLLAPQIPMLFMGEEWGASTPFQFFVDFPDEPDLSRAVRDGRRLEFAHFAAFEDPEKVPDPTQEATFLRSVLDVSECGRPPHEAILAETRRLLALRRDHVLPLTRTAFLGADALETSPDAIDVRWRYGAGSLRFAARFGETETRLTLGDGDRIVWLHKRATKAGQDVVLSGWTGVAIIEAIQ